MALGKTLSFLKSAALETLLTGDPSATLGEAKKAIVKDLVTRDVASLSEGDSVVAGKLKKQAKADDEKKRVIEAAGFEVDEE